MKKKINVIHVIADLGNGGAERQLIELLKLNSYHKLLILKDAGIYKEVLERFNINYTELKIKKSSHIFFYFYKIKKIIEASDTEIIHSWMYNACAIVSIIKFLTSLPHRLIWGIRCSNMNLRHYSIGMKLTILLCKIFSNLPNEIVYNSYAGLRYHNNIGFSKKSNSVIYNGIDSTKFFYSSDCRNKLRKILGIKKEDLVIVFAARVDPMKNHLNLIKAFDLIRSKNKKAVLLLIGKGTDELLTTEGVIALGMKIKIENYYSVGDMIIMPSAYGEGFSNVLAEGMLCNLFPITTDVGDSIKIVANIGLVAKNSSVKELSKVLSKALKIKKSDLRNLQKKSRNKILKEFNIKKMSLQYKKCYKKYGLICADLQG